MKLKEDFKDNLKNNVTNQMSSAISNIDPSSHMDFMKAGNEMNTAIDNMKEEEEIIRKPFKKGVGKKITGKSKMKLPIGKLFSFGKTNEGKILEITKKEIEEAIRRDKESINEKWSEKYKKSIDCNNPKGFSQRAHCQGRKKKETNEEILKGGKADKKTLQDIAKKHDKKGYYHIDNMIDSLKKQLNKGIKVEMEHTKNKTKAKEIAMDHLFEDPNYYDKLKKIESKEAMGASSAGGFLGPVGFDPNSDFVKKSFSEKPKKVETKEATGSASAGSYVTTAAWAKSTSKKDWRGRSKTQIPGGKFVQVKKKCKKFPYCNQGDINALKLSNEQKLMEAIKNVSKKQGISEDLVKQILLFELNKSK